MPWKKCNPMMNGSSLSPGCWTAIKWRAGLAEGVGFEPTREREPPGGFQDRCLKPLGHPSIVTFSSTYASS